MKEESYGVFHVKPVSDDVERLIERNGRVLIRDLRGVMRVVVDKRGTPVKTIRDATKLVKSYRVVFKGYGLKKKVLITPKGNFASGLLYLVREFLAKEGVMAVTEDTRVRPSSSRRHCVEVGWMKPYQKQLEAAYAAADAGQGTISMVTAYGKSYTMAMLVNLLSLKTLIVVPNLTLREQLRADFIELFGTLGNVTIEHIMSPALEHMTDFDVLILDEAHHAASDTYRRLNKKQWKGIYYRFFFTATPFRSREEETILFESIAGKVIYEVNYHDAVKDGAIVPIEAYYVDLPERDIDSNPTQWAPVYKELVVDNPYRNEIIASLLQNLASAGKSTLCLVKEIEHGERLQTLAMAANPREQAIMIPFIKGENDDNAKTIDRFNIGDVDGMVGTDGVCGEGVNTRRAEFGIIAGLGKSKIRFMQQIGRLLRKYPGKTSGKVIIFRDSSHRWTLEHFRAQCRILQEEYGVKPVKLSLTSFGRS